MFCVSRPASSLEYIAVARTSNLQILYLLLEGAWYKVLAHH